ncbi:DNA-binding SARP family transcriptional activator [Krasilnikovia cinnamomea]|uniref:DNA-binding SARP family transcriptional activator n=1 Tax=Krasilnikovia cinnamomea TaxID=349313 RepID=A0A4Q7ZRY9_9ACTN|nr:tetratricopeptide repeat protein [Krasilnikovia cinnamomea]RZU53581.1 DNA-binding SARP family transcriptional activator [Krasilnikovia cinnamomea]
MELRLCPARGENVRIQVLGPVRAWLGEVPVELTSAGRRAVLGLLAMAGGQPLSQAELVDALWGDRPPPTAANIIQTHIKHLRRLLEPGRVSRSHSARLPRVGDGYALRVSPDNLDLLRFRKLLAAAGAAQQRGDPRGAADLFAEALAQWQGAPLMDVPLLAGHPKVIALAEERHAALGRYGELMITLGAVSEALPALEEAAAAQPLDEVGQARLIRAYAVAGRRAKAFATFHDTRRRLADELGVDPGHALSAAHAAALGDPGVPAAVPAALPGPAPTPPAPVRPVPAQLPADVPGFTGREEELAVLDLLVTDHHEQLTAVVIAAVSGMAGVGKTALVVRWAHRARSRFPDGQLYVNLRGYDVEQPTAPEDALAGFLRALGMSGLDIPASRDERAATYRSLLDGRRVLVVLDNAASVDQLRPLLPGTPTCAVVVTSRDTLPGLVARNGAGRLLLPLLPRDEALILITRLIGDRVRGDPAAADDLIGRCAGLPLALRVAAELAIGRPDVPLRDLVAELANEGRRLELLDAGGDPQTGVRAVFSWSYRQLSPAAARAFRLLGRTPGPDVAGYAAAALLDTGVAEAGELLEVLARAHLIQRTAADRFTLHDLLRAYAVNLSAEIGDGAADAALDRLFDATLFTATAAMDTLYPVEQHRRARVKRPESPIPPVGGVVSAQTWLDRERANLVALVAHAATQGRPMYAVQLTLILLRYLESGGHYPEAVAMHEHAVRAARLCDDAAAEAQLLTNVAVMDVQQGNYEQADGLLRRAVELARKCGDDSARARALGNLGHVDQWRGRYDEAAERLREALALCRRTGDQAAEARALGNLGQVYRRQGLDEQAAAYLSEAVRICRRIGDPVGEGYALVSLGDVAARQRDSQRAVRCHREALAVFRRTNERAGTALALDGLGTATHDTVFLREALEIFRQLGERSGETRATNSLGEVLTTTGRPRYGREEHRAALTLAIETGDRYEQGRAHAGLARVAEMLDDPDTAGRHWTQAWTRYAEIGAPEAEDIRAIIEPASPWRRRQRQAEVDGPDTSGPAPV